MTRRERLTATLRGKPVDRPPVCFYELNGLDQNPHDDDPFNIFNHPSWKPLIELTREKTDCTVLRTVPFTDGQPGSRRSVNEYWDPDSIMVSERVVNRRTYIEGTTRYTHTEIRVGKRTLTSLARRDQEICTIWAVEHLLKSQEDLEFWLDLPDYEIRGVPDVRTVLDAEEKIGDAGIVIIDTPDPLCIVALLFDMAEYTVVAMTQQDLFHRALKRVAATLYKKTEAIAKALPGRAWRIYGPELASPPYLPPQLFREYVVQYVKPMVQIIQKYGGSVRIHSHGRLRDILDMIVETGCTGLDPIEPPPQGDVELEYVRKNYGRELVLFGNLEACDLENLPTPLFEKKIRKALEEGTAGEGRGFVLMPSAGPYGRVLPELALRNYEKMVELTERFG